MKRFISMLTACVMTLILFPTANRSTQKTAVNAEETVIYTIEDIRNLQDFLLAKPTSESLVGKPYDLNHDDRWDVFDLCLMKRAYIEQHASETDGNTLVVYFSCSGNTEKVAGYVAEATDGTLFEIEPSVPYTAADLNYGDSSARATAEQNIPDARPEIANSVNQMERYDTVYLGFPIWWGKEPKIIDTFIESYDFSDKIVIPFCTSASSGISGAMNNIRNEIPDATVMDGKRFAASTSAETVSEWVHGMQNELKALQDNKSLVAYFSYPLENDVDAASSASVVVVDDIRYGATEYVAHVIAEQTNSDLFQIRTEQSYGTTFDEVTKNVKAEKDANAYPTLSEHISHLDEYDTLYIGFPTWSYDMPQIMYAFFEEHDLSGKTIYLFNTSGGSQFSGAIDEIKAMQPNAVVMETGLSVYWTSVSTSKDKITQWVNQLSA